MSNVGRGFVTGAAGGAAAGAMVGGPVGAVVGGVLGGLSGVMQGQQADEAEELADLQAKFTRLETAENVKRMQETAEATVDEARAIVGAQNLVISGSSQNYINALKSQWQADVAWRAESGRRAARIQEKGGSAAASQIMGNLTAQAVSAVGTAAVASYAPSPGGDGYYVPDETRGVDWNTVWRT